MVVIAGNAETHRRIADALAEQGLRASAQIGEASEIAELAMDTPAVVVFVCDIDVPRDIADLRRLCREGHSPAVVVISPPATGTAVRRALDAGAAGLVFAPELERALVPTVHAVSIGQSVVPGEFRASVEKPILSHREQQVLALVRKGLTNAEIAEQLFLAESTVKSHLASIFTKFGVRSRKEVAVAFADLEQSSLVSAVRSDSTEQATA